MLSDRSGYDYRERCEHCGRTPDECQCLHVIETCEGYGEVICGSLEVAMKLARERNAERERAELTTTLGS